MSLTKENSIGNWISVNFRCFNGRLLVWLAVVAAGVATTAAPAQAQSYRVLHTFSGVRDGGFPYGGLIRDPAGNIYGTTLEGGFFSSGFCGNGGGCGVVFKLDTAARETVLDNFQAPRGGARPPAGVTQDSQGNLYGVTGVGGNAKCNAPYGCGSVFKIDATGKQTTLHQFAGGSDGARPQASLILDAVGNLYGTTGQGGPANTGTVFKIDTSGKETVLYAFGSKPDGATPIGALVRDPQGNLYGSTELGGTGTNCGSLGCGVVFEITPAGKETVLYNFSGGADGSEAGDTLVRDSDGNLYGITGLGGDLNCGKPYGCGVVFKLAPAGVETVLYAFTGGTADGSNPISGVIRDAAGNFYGTTHLGGAFGMGTIYELDAAGNESLLYSFTGGSDGAYPYAGLTPDSGGSLYGTTVSGGNTGCGGLGCGVVFEFVP